MPLVETLAAPTRILIVDDDASVRDVISVLLQEEGYECRTAAGAARVSTRGILGGLQGLDHGATAPQGSSGLHGS